MARKDFLDDIDEVTAGADLKSEKKAKSPTSKPSNEKEMKTIEFPKGWSKMIKDFTGSPATGYMREAIREKMTRDGIL